MWGLILPAKDSDRSLDQEAGMKVKLIIYKEFGFGEIVKSFQGDECSKNLIPLEQIGVCQV